MNPNRVCDKKTKNTPLHIAFNTGNLFIVMLLIKRGANLNSVNKNGHTPLAFDKGNLLRKLNL
jgi:ankyrin repeat protein